MQVASGVRLEFVVVVFDSGGGVWLWWLLYPIGLKQRKEKVADKLFSVTAGGSYVGDGNCSDNGGPYDGYDDDDGGLNYGSGDDDDVMDRIMRMVSERPVVIFSKSTCILSHTIKSLFNDLGVNPMVYELDEIARGQEIEQALSRHGCTMVPVVFISGELVGGANEIMSLQLKSVLKPMLITAGALWV
ncbi:hypothetical protein QVD17_39748 [Tagetes erecta]|uniref:Glutaredoxin domain-containing protein n=1 Tax=Tagetes erecta TaxID=13708 RepID=A0AAD8JP37_TARER|nr:hypothetical protein QVD17_39748 [Tagetes erecta]